MKLETFTENGFTVEICSDLYPASPREDDFHGAELVLDGGRNWTFPDDADINPGGEYFEGWEDLAQRLVKPYTVTDDFEPENIWHFASEAEAAAFISALPDAEDGRYSLAAERDRVPALAEPALLVLPVYGWADSSSAKFTLSEGYRQIGLAYVTAAGWEETQGSAWTGSVGDLVQARRLIESDLFSYEMYVNGDVFAYVITDFDGEIVDELSGIYGYEDAESEARASASSLTHEIKCTGMLNRRTGNVDHESACPLHQEEK